MKIDETRLKTLSILANEMKQEEREIQKLEMLLEKAKERHKQLSADEIPSYMADLGLTQFALTDGTKFKIVPIFDVRLPKERMEIADTWLEENGHTGLIKTKIDVSVSKLSEKIAAIKQALDQIGIKYDIQKTIHYQTLNAWAREIEAEGMVIPENIFNVYRSTKTVIEGM